MMSRNSVLLVSYYFPPCGGVAVQRSAKFAKYLGRFGWQPVVLTDEARVFAHLPQDEDLLSEISDVEILRTSYAFRESFFRNVYRLRLNGVMDFLTPVDMHYLWSKQATRVAAQLAQKENVDAIYTTSPPASAHLVGLSTAKVAGIPWVADFRDPWTQWHKYSPKTRLHAMWDKLIESMILKHADFVIANTQGSREILLKEYGHSYSDKIVVIPNGYDEDDFVQIRDIGADSGKLWITYIGTVYGEYADPNDRDFPRSLFRAIAQLKREHLELAESVRFRFAGNFSSQNQAVLDELRIKDMVDVVGHVSHRRALEFAMSSGANLLLMSGWPGNMIQAKLYELIRAGKPILAFVPEGNARRLLEDLGGHYIAAPDDEESMFDKLMELVKNHLDRQLTRPNSSADNIERFERCNLARDLAAILNQACQKTQSPGELHVG